nr:hypothetical protein [Tanacetum cinerariifolium]
MACTNCCLVEFARKAKADAIKEEAKIKFEHKGHPQHPLTLKLRPGSFHCDDCKFAMRRMKHCANCRYFSHIKCALNAQQQPSTSRDDPRTFAASEDVSSLLHFPMLEAFTNPLKLFHSENLAQDDDETAEIYHWSHRDHPLILNVEDPQGNNMMSDINSGEPIEACDCVLGIYCAMRSPLSLAHRYCKGREIPLTYPPVEDHPADFYCDICEEEMDPNLLLYHWQKCKYRNSFHLDCISRNHYYA